jgi:hypothetical protein
MQLLNKMEEQKFIDLMFMIMLTSKVEDDFASNVTEFIRKNGLPFKNCLEIKESSIHGKGVFAKRDISSGMIVGVYPCHGVIEDRKYSFIPYYSKYFDEQIGFEDYKIYIGNNKFIFGIPSIQEDYLAGHLINDSYPYVNELALVNDFETFSKQFEKYTIYSLSNNNCRFIRYNGLLYIKTIKPIKYGEELVTSYDTSYWCKSMDLVKCEEMLAKYCSSLCGKKKQYILDILKKIYTESNPGVKPSEEIIKIMPIILSIKK